MSVRIADTDDLDAIVPKVADAVVQRLTAMGIVAPAGPDPEEFLRESDLPALTGLARSTLEGMRREGRGPRFVKLGRAVRYKRGDVMAWLAGTPPRRSNAEVHVAAQQAKKKGTKRG